MGLLNISGPLFIHAVCWLTLVSAARNFSIDDTDLFQFTGNWSRIQSTMDINGGHMVTQSPGAFASITYTFASVYFVSAKWPFKVTTDYAIDGDTPMTVDMQDHSKVFTGDDSPTVAAGVVGQWTSTVNQQHTIHITVPPGDQYAVVDMFIFEVLDPSDTSSITTSTSTISSTTSSTIVTNTRALTVSPSSSLSLRTLTPVSSSLSTSTPSSSSSGSQGVSSQVRTLAISMAIVGTLLAILLIFLLWWCCIRRKQINGKPIAPYYHPVPTGNLAITPFTGDRRFGSDNNAGVFMTPVRENPMFVGGNGVGVPVTNNLALLGYGNSPGHGGIVASGKLQRETLNYYSNISSHSAQPSTSSANQASSSLLIPLRPTHQTPHVPHLSAPSVMSDSPPMYTRDSDTTSDPSIMIIGRNSVLDESRRSNGSSSRIPSHTTQFSAGSEPDDSATLTATTEANKERNSAWDIGYPQPLRFIPIS